MKKLIWIIAITCIILSSCSSKENKPTDSGNKTIISDVTIVPEVSISPKAIITPAIGITPETTIAPITEDNKVFSSKDAIDLVIDELDREHTDDLYIDNTYTFKPGTYLIELKQSIGMEYFRTKQMFLVKDGEIVSKLYDDSNLYELNPDFSNTVDELMISTLVQDSELDDRLCMKDEEILISFKIQDSNKVLTVCTTNDGRYITYRFGTKENVELIYPENKIDSWSDFSYWINNRGESLTYAGYEYDYLTFLKDGYKYKIYYEYGSSLYDENDVEILKEYNEVGICVIEIATNKVTNIKGDHDSLIGSINNNRIRGRAEENMEDLISDEVRHSANSSTSGTTINTIAALSEGALAMEAYKSVLQNKICFYSPDDEKNTYLVDF